MGVKIVQPGPRQAPSSPSPQPFRLGDAVETAVKPVARALGIEDCAPCRRRKERLNAISDHVSARVRNLFRRK